MQKTASLVSEKMSLEVKIFSASLFTKQSGNKNENDHLLYTPKASSSMQQLCIIALFCQMAKFSPERALF